MSQQKLCMMVIEVTKIITGVTPTGDGSDNCCDRNDTYWLQKWQMSWQRWHLL